MVAYAGCVHVCKNLNAPFGSRDGRELETTDLLAVGRFPLRDRPLPDGTAIELPKLSDLRAPEFICNLSDAVVPPWFWPRAEIHGSYLVSRPDVTLFGPSQLLSQTGLSSCETRAYKRPYLEHVAGRGFGKLYPGAKPAIEFEGDEVFLDFSNLRPCDVEPVAEPVFLATPLEPDNWGRWIATTVPKTAQFKGSGAGRKFLCRAAHPWQRNFLQLLGIQDSQLMNHDPGKTYFCRDAVTVEYSVTNMSVSDSEKQIYAELAEKCRRSSSDHFGERIFISRLSHSAKHPHYRVLQNERELANALNNLGFKTVEPEKLSITEQIGMFARARCVVALGGAALFSACFCPPGTKVVTVEASEYFIRAHSMLLSSMGHRFGIIFGQQDRTDPSPIHKRWSIDVPQACAAIQGIL